MQNTEFKSTITKAELSDLAEGASAAGGGGEASADLCEKLEEEVGQQQQAKIKSRSRLSAAFRSFSKPKTKKDKEQPPDRSKERTLEKGQEELAISELDVKQKKKNSLTRRLLLGSLKKSKVRPQSLISDQEEAATSTSASTSRSSVQITISGKKIEPATGRNNSKSRKGAATETDYLTPTTTAAEAAVAAVTASTAATASKAKQGKSSTTTTAKSSTRTTTTKVIVAKVSKAETTASSSSSSSKKKAKTKKLSSEQPEKIVITESTRDTPPRERAPAKPSRLSANASGNQSTTNSGAVRKLLVASGKGATPITTTTTTSSGLLGTGKRSQRTIATVTASLSRKERELMQQQQQRGHRIASHRPLTTTTVKTEDNPPTAEPLQPPTYPPPPVPPPEVNLSDETDEHAVSSAESAQAVASGQEQELNLDLDQQLSAAPVRFVVGSAVRPPATVNTYETALAAAAAQQPSSSESRDSETSLRRLHFANQGADPVLGDHDSIEGRRETLRYQSVVTEYSCDDSQSEDSAANVQQPSAHTPTSMPAFGDLTMDHEMEPTIMSPSSAEKREHLYKILVIGELGTGKTSFIKRYVHQFFSQNYRATIGVDFALKVLHWDANTIVRLQLWDIAGQERFGNMTRVYYKEAVGAFIVFDVTRSGTFDCVSKWKEDLDSKVQLPDGSPIPCILLANKCDQDKQGIVTQTEKMDEYVRENGFAGWFETSAKENINIDEAARALVNKILINDKLITAADLADADKFNLGSASEANAADAKSKCAC